MAPEASVVAGSVPECGVVRVASKFPWAAPHLRGPSAVGILATEAAGYMKLFAAAIGGHQSRRRSGPNLGVGGYRSCRSSALECGVVRVVRKFSCAAPHLRGPSTVGVTATKAFGYMKLLAAGQQAPFECLSAGLSAGSASLGASRVFVASQLVLPAAGAWPLVVGASPVSFLTGGSSGPAALRMLSAGLYAGPASLGASGVFVASQLVLPAAGAWPLVVGASPVSFLTGGSSGPAGAPKGAVAPLSFGFCSVTRCSLGLCLRYGTGTAASPASTLEDLVESSVSKALSPIVSSLATVAAALSDDAKARAAERRREADRAADRVWGVGGCDLPAPSPTDKYLADALVALGLPAPSSIDKDLKEALVAFGT
eukprot:CAMPEP_0172647624 /NCGR_PEP_ID=MMETSP1068-20121228/240844_1 /TAXON_ID=35684 /ORGANISM="Pseudopedinella elastica, Strain CCMP716" /LENGTH=369 /DNA_ID=CAMNT_0013461905 /DNA_START=289 /DNA_END=1397 /DNA_ORIENTATION=+